MYLQDGVIRMLGPDAGGAGTAFYTVRILHGFPVQPGSLPLGHCRFKVPDVEAKVVDGRPHVSPLCLGTMTFGEEWGWGSSVPESEAIMARFLDRGGNFIDTANGYTLERTYAIVDELLRIGRELGTNPAAVALAWVQSRPGVASTIIGARTLDQLEQNLLAADLTLTSEQIAALDRLSEPTRY